MFNQSNDGYQKSRISIICNHPHTPRKSEDKMVAQKGNSNSDSKKSIFRHKPNKAIRRVTIQESEKGPRGVLLMYK